MTGHWPIVPQLTDPSTQPPPASMMNCGAHTPQSTSPVAAAATVVRPAGQGVGAEALAGQKAPTGQGWPGSTVPAQKLLLCGDRAPHRVAISVSLD